MLSLPKFIFMLMLSVFTVTATAQPANFIVSAEQENTETVFDWSQEKCVEEHIPDSPARAFRSQDGSVHLYATHYINIPFTGPSLKKVKPDCQSTFSANMDSAPEYYNARIWLQSFYAEDNGKNVYSLGSSDYHASWFDKCPDLALKNKDCWWSSIVLAHSEDGGHTFNTPEPPHHIVARSPQFFSSDSGGPTGFFTTSNIQKKSKYYYSIFYVSANKGQFKGNCLARTATLGDPSSWQAWDGEGFNKSFFTAPEKSTYDSHDYCKTLQSLPYKIRSLIWHAPSQKYLAIFEKVKKIDAHKNRVDVEFNYAWSDNLIDWSKPENIMSVKGSESCSHPQALAAYPSLIDSESTDQNFGTVGNRAYLYYTKFNVSDKCQLTLDRDLVRVPVNIHE